MSGPGELRPDRPPGRIGTAVRRGDDAAGLAAAIPAPHTSNPRSATTAWRNRRDAIIGRMERADWLRRRLEGDRTASSDPRRILKR